ncbi:MAG TPA: class I SAM-dependent methyltransferase [Candidatus Paceibacterota bacterium]|nr:class I SAM-dependent methyltransferase [Candidatus Paceibacterota bacterium]
MNDIAQNWTQLRAVKINATRAVAYDSPDHLVPWGTRRDNSRNRRFNQKLYRLFGEQRGPLSLLDMGCSGGGFVKDCLDDGCLAVGLEGSDFSKRFRRAEWRTIPEYLFTADITAPFEITGEFADGTRKLQFDAITSWEVMEHIQERDLPAVAANVKNHLRSGGIWIMSVASQDDFVNGVNLHQTVKPREWWIQKFASLGLHHVEAYVRYFNTQFVRGPKYMAPGSFHLALTNDPALAPAVPPESLIVRISDRWLGSTLQRLLRYGITGN